MIVVEEGGSSSVGMDTADDAGENVRCGSAVASVGIASVQRLRLRLLMRLLVQLQL